MKNPVQQILNIYQKHGHIVYGEDCSVLSHSFQAGVLARAKGMDDQLVLAAFLHDIGHLSPLENNEEFERMDEFGIESHDKLGADFLEALGFPNKIITTIKNHVNSKRYLCSVDKDYFDQLSEASKKTMEFQGGVMPEGEAVLFEHSLFFEESIAIRKIDEEAKGINFKILPEHWDLFSALLEQQLNHTVK